MDQNSLQQSDYLITESLFAMRFMLSKRLVLLSVFQTHSNIGTVS